MDKITLNNVDGTKEEIEIVATFKLEKFNNADYVIYRQDDRFFGARYVEENGKTELIVDGLSEEEKDALGMIFHKFHKGGLV